MNWGTRITILYLGFVALILTLVFTCFGEKVELESKDYYTKELKFQDQINATANAEALVNGIEHKVINKSVLLQLPKELLGKNLKGSVVFMRPSDSSLDKTINLQTDSLGKQILRDSSFKKGVYKMQLSLTSNNTSYFKEAVVFFQ